MKVFDLHCDTLSELRRAEMRGDGQTFAHNNGHIDLEKLEKLNALSRRICAEKPAVDQAMSWLRETLAACRAYRTGVFYLYIILCNPALSYAVYAVKNTYSVRLVHNVIALFKLIERAYLLPRLVLAFMLFTLGRYKPVGY